MPFVDVALAEAKKGMVVIMKIKEHKVILLFEIFLLINIFLMGVVYAKSNENKIISNEVANDVINRNR